MESLPRLARPAGGVKRVIPLPPAGAGASLPPAGSHLRAPRWGRSGAVGTGPRSPGRRCGRWAPPPRPPGPRAPHSPARTAPAASPRGGRRRLCRSPAGPRGAGDSAPLLPPPPPPHPRRVPPPLLLPALRLLPPLRPPPAPPPPPPPGPRPGAPPSPKSGSAPRPGGSYIAPARPAALPEPAPWHGAARLSARRPASVRGEGERAPGRGRRTGRRGRPGARGQGTPRGALPAPPARQRFTSGSMDAWPGRPGPADPPRTALAPKCGPGRGSSGERGSGQLSASRCLGTRLAALPAPSAHPRRDTDAHSPDTHSLPLALGGELKQLWDSPRSWK